MDVAATADKGPLTCRAFARVVASPHSAGADVVTHWEKAAETPTQLYMPSWEEAELQLCRRIITPTRDERAEERRAEGKPEDARRSPHLRGHR